MIMGFNHDDKSDGSGKDGITSIFTDDVAKKNMFEKADLDSLFLEIKDDGSANISWENTSLRSWISDSFSNGLPSDLSEQIVSVDKADEYWLYELLRISAARRLSIPAIR